MKHLLTIISCFVALSMGAQTGYPYPYQPDSDNDGVISVEDLMSLLAIFGMEYDAELLSSDSSSAIFYVGEYDYWDCSSACNSLLGNWKILDSRLVGSYKNEIQSHGDYAWVSATELLFNDPPGSMGWKSTLRTSDWEAVMEKPNISSTCICQTRVMSDVESLDLCADFEDECGVCQGPGAIFECGCNDIPEGDCDCEGNQLDAIGVCGGDCLEDLDGDGICDPVCGNGIVEGDEECDDGNSNPDDGCDGCQNAWSCGDPLIYFDYSYETVEIGYQCWLAENLRTVQFSNGDSLVAVNNFQEFSEPCFFVQPNCDNGNLYNSIAMFFPFSGLCPSNWRLPNAGEFEYLVDQFGGQSVAAPFLRSEIFNGNNYSGFSALPMPLDWYAGDCRDEFFAFYTESTALNSWECSTGLLYFHENTNQVEFQDCASSEMFYPIRCIKD